MKFKMSKNKAKSLKPKVDFYRFVEDFTFGGITVYKDVSLKGTFVVEKNCVSLVGSLIFKDIPLDYLEKFEPINRVKKPRENKKIEAGKTSKKSNSESARVSDRKV